MSKELKSKCCGLGFFGTSSSDKLLCQGCHNDFIPEVTEQECVCAEHGYMGKCEAVFCECPIHSNSTEQVTQRQISKSSSAEEEQECKNKISGCNHKPAKDSEYCLSCQIKSSEQGIEESWEDKLKQEWSDFWFPKNANYGLEFIQDWWIPKVEKVVNQAIHQDRLSREQEFNALLEQYKSKLLEKIDILGEDKSFEAVSYNNALGDIKNIIKGE